MGISARNVSRSNEKMGNIKFKREEKTLKTKLDHISRKESYRQISLINIHGNIETEYSKANQMYIICNICNKINKFRKVWGYEINIKNQLYIYMLAMTYPKLNLIPFKITLKRTLRNTFSKRHAKNLTLKTTKDC